MCSTHFNFSPTASIESWAGVGQLGPRSIIVSGLQRYSETNVNET